MSKQGGFTLVELITVMIVLGILSAVALPRIMDNRAFIGAAFHADVVSALRYAQKSAVSHRRLVCARLDSIEVTLWIATSNPAITCGATVLSSPDGTAYLSKDASIQILAVSPPVLVGGYLYFQPSGTITSDVPGLNLYSPDRSITITGRATTPIKIEGATGYVE